VSDILDWTTKIKTNRRRVIFMVVIAFVRCAFFACVLKRQTRGQGQGSGEI
jgi:hypothetical protein